MEVLTIYQLQYLDGLVFAYLELLELALLLKILKRIKVVKEINMNILKWSFIIIFILWLFIFYLKRCYLYLAIVKVYIPEFHQSRKEFINNEPLQILNKQKK